MDVDKVVLIDEFDNQIGLEVKLVAHQGGGRLHRAVSVLAWRIKDGLVEFLIHKRSRDKSLWPGIWTNTVCTHPGDGESYRDCAVRRLAEEMGIRVAADQLEELFRFKYQAGYNDEMSENELDCFFLVKWDGVPKIDQNEIDNYLWIDRKTLTDEMKDNPAGFTPWFHIIMKDESLKKYKF